MNNELLGNSSVIKWFYSSTTIRLEPLYYITKLHIISYLINFIDTKYYLLIYSHIIIFSIQHSKFLSEKTHTNHWLIFFPFIVHTGLIAKSILLIHSIHILQICSFFVYLYTYCFKLGFWQYYFPQMYK